MAETSRPSTPPRRPQPAAETAPITPEQVRRMEESRLRAKAVREQQDAQRAKSSKSSAPPYAAPQAGQKRPHSSISSANPPPTTRDARTSAVPPNARQQQQQQPNSNNGLARRADTDKDTDIRAARKFQQFVEYDFSKMTDTKGGFMTAEDDPHNKALHAPEDGRGEQRPKDMTLKEWERLQLEKRLRKQRAGPYEPGLSVLDVDGDGDRDGNGRVVKKCRDCGTLEIDWLWDDELKVQVCMTCKEKYPEKYSLLTKTEAKEDYLLTDPELKDTSLLPHLEKPNPHKSSWNNMMLYLRFQVEEYAFSAQKWGSPENLDLEFERRQREGKERKEKKFKSKLLELKKRTRVDAYKKARGGGGGEFGDVIGRGRHEHEWGQAVEDADGVVKKRCVECGMEVEELEF